ncbi:hypothetical protein GCM10022247_56490 [Allokutzneria multivorans]|uniref:Carrier domain-containing protein n=1 Tax=Allokutzneria multivorans TaxID=1142134 RepID=A0ABP7TDK0_9PSEU
MKRSALEDVLPLSPLQEGMYFHASYDEGGVDVYHSQFVLGLGGAVEPDVLRAAASALLRRYPVLRSGFRLRKNGEPIQVIHRAVAEAWAELDLSEVDGHGLEGFLAEDRQRSFDLAKPPLMRFTLVKLAPTAYKLVITNHHILVDGWSWGVLMEDLFTLYAQRGEAVGMPLVVPYRNYPEWLSKQDSQASLRVWREALDGVDRPTVLAPDIAGESVVPARITVAPEGLGAEVDRVVRASKLTAATLVQAAWASVLQAVTGREDVVFGTTVSGRAPEIPGVQKMVGMFINTVPVRVRLRSDEPVADNLVRLRDEQSKLLAHQYLRLTDVVRQTGLPTLFDTFVIFENYPVDFSAREIAPGVRLTDVGGQDAAHYPLRLAAALTDQRLEVLLEYRPDVFDAEAAQWIADAYVRALWDVVRRWDEPFGQPLELSEVDRQRMFGSFVDAAPEIAEPVRSRRPRDSREEILCGLVAEVLGRENVGVDEDFFALGGHSLSAIRLLSRVRAVFGVELPVRVIFEAPTVALLSERVRGGGSTRPALRPGIRPAHVPLSSAQRRLWFIQQLEGPNATYNLPMPVRLTGELDRQALIAALGDVVARHESLRTVVAESHQWILDAATKPVVQVVDVTEEELPSALRTAAATPFDLARDLPIRAWLFALSEREHVLLLVPHHIAMDGWSAGPLWSDIVAAYSARRSGTGPQWTPLPAQYADYALWQQELLGSEEDPESLISEQLGFWRDTLSGSPDWLELPTDRRRPAAPSRLGDTVEFSTGSQAHAGLVKLAHTSQASVFMAVHAALAALLTRLGAGTDIPIGTAVAGRGDQALDELVGFFVNTLVLRADTSGDPTFRELLARVRQTDLAALANQDVPFERLVEVVNPVRSPAHHPLFQVMLAFQNTGGEISELPGLTASAEGFGVGVAKFDLSFSVRESFDADGAPAGLEGVLEYSADLFDRDTARAIVDRLVRLITEAVEEPDRVLSGLELLSDEEKRQLVAPPAVAAVSTLPELFQAQVARTPDSPAVECEGVVLTYAELNARANRLAHRLIAEGIGPESIVALTLRRSIDYVVSVLAVSKAGGAYLPVDPEYPAERIDHVLSDAKPAMTITTSIVDADYPDTDPVAEITPDHPAYVIYTSGSTGKPRGVVVTHAGLAALSANQIEHYRVDSDSRVLQFVSPSFDVSVAELSLALLSGACFVVPPRQLAGAELAAALVGRRITHVMVPPSVMSGVPKVELPSLRAWITGAETCPEDLVDFWARDRLMINAYGPTEATCDVTFTACSPGRPLTIGTAIDGMATYVLDSSLRPVPPGVVGELYLAGRGLARGYLGDPATTAARFVASPFGDPGTRLYRTGDLARWRGGRLELAGRVDTQVKLRGFRIELGEIETALRRHDKVDAAVAIVREDRPGDRRLVAYVVGDVPGPELRSYLATCLPDYMVPSSFVGMDTLPLLPNGKLDRRALPEPVVEISDSAPRTPREKVLCGLFAEALGVAEVGVDDDFFELGGHSLLGVELAGRIGAVLGAELTVRAVFDAPTPAALAALLDGEPTQRDAFGALLPLRAKGTRPPLFCLPPIAGMSWRYTGLLRALDSEIPVYALQSRGLDGDEERPQTMEAMVADFAELIRSVQPEGPYHLVGWSFGGNLAHALATHLEDVGLLAILDAYPAEESKRGQSDRKALLASMFEEYAKAYGDEGAEVPEDEESLRARIVDYLGRGSSELSRLDEQRRSAVLEVMVTNATLALTHEPESYPGDVVLVVAGRSRKDWATPESWKSTVDGEIIVHEVDCLHENMMEPGPATEICEILEAGLPQEVRR